MQKRITNKTIEMYFNRFFDPKEFGWDLVSLENPCDTIIISSIFGDINNCLNINNSASIMVIHHITKRINTLRKEYELLKLLMPKQPNSFIEWGREKAITKMAFMHRYGTSKPIGITVSKDI